MTFDDLYAEVYQTDAGQWAFRVLVEGVEMAGGGGYGDPWDAQEAAESVLLGFAAGLDADAGLDE